MNYEEADKLLVRYLDQTASPKERALIENWYLHESEQRKLTDADDFDHLAAELWAGTRKRAGLDDQPKSGILWSRIVAAASVLVILSLLALFLSQYQKNKSHDANDQMLVKTSGTRYPVLILENGKKITLDSAARGLPASKESGGMILSNTGVLAYEKTLRQEKGVYHSLLVPSGAGLQRLVLPDGTRVWMNAASSLRYPVAFAAHQRTVELSGEAYFEVAHQAERPFRVISKKQTVEVLGTHFNVNAYDDEPEVQTTLLEGRVKVVASADHAVRYLSPGEQSALQGKTFSVTKVEAAEVLSWKDGELLFEDDRIQQIMRVLARWYDVDVEYRGTIPEDQFGGTISRKASLSENLNILQFTGKVQFHIEGKRVVVSK